MSEDVGEGILGPDVSDRPSLASPSRSLGSSAIDT